MIVTVKKGPVQPLSRTAERQPRTSLSRYLGALRSNLQAIPKERESILPVSRRIPLKPVYLREWACIMSNVVLVGLVTFDLFHHSSSHIMKPIDDGVHLWVIENVPVILRNELFAFVLSNAVMVSTSIAWLYLDLYVSRTSGSLLRRLLTSENINLGTCAVAMEAIGAVSKEVFRRPRPRTDLLSFSYPSGHTLTAVMISGMFIFIKLRPFLKEGESDRRDVDSWRIQALLTTVWISCGGLTAVGRIGADAHWFTDTLVGGSLGVMIVSFLFQRRRFN